MKETGIVLFAHGSRDPLWRAPFDTMLHAACEAHDGPVVLAFLESMHPTFDEAIDTLAARGVRSIRIVPLFLAAGSHIREDMPQLIEKAGLRHPEIAFTTLHVMGDDKDIQAAIVHYALGR
jgi:sirohydrochlorin cobaltochelatase